MQTGREYHYRIVDVFTRKALEGNALAVFLDGTGLGDTAMQKLARELNLSETVFLFPPSQPEYAASLRIFTPSRELPFAGHPTVGASFVILEEGIVPKGSERFVLDEKIGPVPIRVEGGDRPLIWLTTPPIHDGPTFDAALCASAIGLMPEDLMSPPPQLLTAGNPTILIALKDKAAVDRASMDTTGMARFRTNYPEPACVMVFAPTPEGAYTRMFAPEYGIVEDPATGSATGPLAAYMMRHKLIAATLGNRFHSEQGTKMGRRSILHIHLADGKIDVGGHVTPLARGILRLDGGDA